MILKIKLQTLKTNKKVTKIILTSQNRDHLKDILGYIHKSPIKVNSNLKNPSQSSLLPYKTYVFLNLNQIEKWLAVGAIPTKAVLKIFKNSCYF